MKAWVDVIMKVAGNFRSSAINKATPHFNQRILNVFNDSVRSDGYQFIMNGNKLTPNDMTKAFNSEFGKQTANGQSTTVDIPKETIRILLVKLKGTGRISQLFDFNSRFDRPNRIFEIEIVAKK
mgnify:CR=1 FL=1